MISTDEACELMKECDLNKDGLIDFEGITSLLFKADFQNNFLHS